MDLDPSSAGASPAITPPASLEVNVRIEDLDHHGRGVARHQGRVLFLDDTLPGDQWTLRLQPQRGGAINARPLQLLHASPDRRRPPCILADHCGGCSLQPLAHPAQQRWKQQLVQQTLRRIGGLEGPVAPLLGADSDLGYRNRAIIPLERDEQGRLRAGFYRRGSHRIVNMNHCPVLDPRLDALIAPLKRDIEARPWPVDRHGNTGGGLRHLALRLGHHSGELLITLIASHRRLEGLQEQAQQWLQRWPAVVGVSLNLQPRPTNQLFGPHSHTLAGRDWLLERFAGLELCIPGDCFFQVHTPQAERVVPLLAAALAPARGHLVDAYCGIGTFSLPLAQLGWRVLGIEQHSGAVEQAQRNAERNGLAERCRFLAADVASALASALVDAAALLLDPPRRGLDARVLAAITARPPAQLLYLSCDPATLARDLGQLCAGAYRLVGLQPIDFFPNTTHVECLAVLERRDQAAGADGQQPG
ncbi:MAG: 23S rRNA (uracil(1939)-C(5))-methyltransferase RlmD [Synechococcus sp.]|nr:23S rRNA (uracil(1939)-C(5))-methyltransferase RlmD [Synechococcus sp.]